MKIFCLCGVVLFVNFLSVQSHYVYGDNPNTGYVSLNNVGDNFPIGFNSKQRRYMSYPKGQTYTNVNERNTKITKSPPAEPTRDNRNQKPTNQSPTEAPKIQQKKEEGSPIHDINRNYKALGGKTKLNQNFNQATMSNNRGIEFISHSKQHDQNFHGKGNIYDSKGNTVQVNVHKTQIAAEPQKVKLNGNRQLTALSVQRRDDNYKKMPTSMLVDNKLQKGPNFKERNAQIMSRVLDDMTKKISDRRMKNNEYIKRDTVSSNDKNANVKRNIASDNIKKYIGSDSRSVGKEHQAARIGSQEEEIEENNAPYALFYRMAPESLDNQEGFYLMKSMEDDGETAMSHKEKRLTVNYQNEVDLKKPKTKKNYNTVKLRKKVKNLSNFKSNNL